MPNQFLSDEFGDIEDYFVTDYWLIDQFVGDTLWGWGQNFDGQLGTNDLTTRSIPITTFAGGTTWKQVAGGRSSRAAIKTDGSLWTWGRNNLGQLGLNDVTYRSIPVTTFAGGTNWKSIASGGYHYVALKTDGTLWTWGDNNTGQLGTNNTTTRSTPVTTFAGGTNWKSVSSSLGFVNSTGHIAAIKTDGSLWLWGRNDAGQLGDNTTTQRNTPVTTFLGGTTWKSVVAGYRCTAAIKTDGSLWTWGSNGSGQLGVNDTNGRTTPVTTFAGGNNWKSVGSEAAHILAIKSDGTLWGWGFNLYGQLGNFSNTDRSTPVTTFSGGTNWKSVAGNIEHSAALKTDGTLWVWGRGDSGRLGTNDTTNRSTPVTTFAGGNNWKQVSCGRFDTAAIQSGLNVDLS